MEHKGINYSFLRRLKYSSQISNELKDIIRQIWQLDLRQNRTDILQKKANIRQQIELGKILMQSGFEDLCLENPRVIYAMLREGKKQIEANPDLISKWDKIDK